MNELDFALQQAGAGDVDVVEQARTRAAAQQRQVTSDDLSALQDAFTLPDDASDDAKAHAAGTISRVYFGQENYDGSIWTGGKPLKPAEHLSMMRDFVRGVAQPPNIKDLADFEALPDDEARFKEAQKKLGPFRRFREGVADLATSDFAPLAQAEEAGAPDNVRAANSILSAYDPRRPDRPANPTVETGTPEYRKAAETVAAYREQLQKKNAVSEYRAKLYAQNAWLQYDGARASLTKDADDVVREAFAMNRLTPGMVEKFKTLPGDQQRLVAGLVHSAKHQGERRLAYDAGRTFVQMAVDVPVKAAQSYVVDAARRAFMDDEEYQRFAETRATLAQMEAPRMAEYGYIGQSVIGFAGTIPYMAAAMIPYAGTAMIAGQAAYDFEQRVAAEGGDVSSAKFQGAKWAMAVAYASVEKLQANRIAKPLTDLEKRQALCQFWRRANAPIAARILAGDTAFETAQEGIQKGIEDGFVAWGLGKDVAAAAAAGTVQEIKDTAGTMFLTSLAGAGGKSIHANVSKNHTLSEIAAGQYHASRLIEATAANDKEAVAKHRATLGSMQRAWRAAGTHENAVRMFTSRGVDPRAADALSRFFEWEYTSVMGDASLTADQKEALVGKDATLSGILQQLMPDATVGENSDGSLSVRRDLNGVRTTTRVQVGDMAKLDVASPEAAASISEALTAAGFKISPEEWLNMAESERRGMVTDYNLRQEGQFKLTAEPTSETEGEPAEVTGQQLSALSGQIDLNAAARPAAVFHEAFHAFVRYLRAAKIFTDADVARLREEFGAPRPGVNEDFNEESAAEAFRSYAAGKVQMVQSTALEKAWDSLWDVLDRFGSLFRRRDQVRTVRETLFQQLASGTYTGIPVGTITEAQRQANAAKKAESARKRPAQKAQQAQEPSKAEKPPETTPSEKPTSGEPVAAKGPSDEEKAAAAAVEAAKGQKSDEPAADEPGKGEWKAVTPQGNVTVRGEWIVLDLGDLITSDQPEYDQTIQPRDRGTVHSRAQIHNIARNPNPDLLFESSKTDDGSPIVLPNRSVLSGNGRVMALREAVQIGTAAPYVAAVRRKAAEMGIAIPDGIATPVLVRRLDRIDGPTTLQRVAELSNQSAVLQRSEAETAEADAKAILEKDLLKLFQPGADGNLLVSSNDAFIAALVRATGDASIVDSNGLPTEATEKRIRRALLAMLVGTGPDARAIVRGLVEDAKELGMKTELAGVMRAAADIVTVSRDKPQYGLLDEIGMALRAYMDMKREGSSPFQADLFGRPPAVDAIVKALWSRSSAGDIAALFSDYAARARLIDTSTAGLGLEKDPTKEELLEQAISATGTGETAEQAQKKKAAAAQAEEPPAPTPPTTQADKAKDKKDQPPVADESGTVDQIPPPSNVVAEAGKAPFGEIGNGWKKIATKVKEQLTEWSKAIPLFQGAKRAMSGRTTKAIRSLMSQAARDAVRTIWDGFGGSGGFGLYHALENFRNANLISIGEYNPRRLAKIKFFHQKGDQLGTIIKSDAFQSIRSEIVDAMIDEVEAATGPALPGMESGQTANKKELLSAGSLAVKATAIIKKHLTGSSIAESDIVAAVQAIIDAAGNMRQEGADTASEVFDKVEAVAIRDSAEIYKAAQAFRDRGGRFEYRDENPDTYDAIEKGLVPPGPDTFVILDPPHYMTTGYNDDTGKAEIVDIKTYGKTRDAIRRIVAQGNSILYTDSAWWIDNPERANPELLVPEDHQIVVDILNALDHFDVVDGVVGKNRHEVIGVHHGREQREEGQTETGQGQPAPGTAVQRQNDGRLPDATGLAGDQNQNLPGMAGGPAGETEGVRRGTDSVGDQPRYSITAGNVRSIQRFYHAFSRGTTPDIADAFDAATTLRNYFAEYLRWYREVWDKSHRGYGTHENDVDANNRVKVAYSQRLAELDKAIQSSDLKKLIVAVDNGVNQWHLDYPVIAHLQMEFEQDTDDATIEPVFDDIVNMLRSLGRLPEQSPYRYSVTAKALKALNTGVYKDRAKQTIADLNRLPATLKPYVAKYDDPDDLTSLSMFAGWKPGPKVAPAHLQTYRPAVRLKSGEIAWHPRARMHAEALSMWLKQHGRDVETFDLDEYYGDGGIGPDGRYYEKSYIGDGPSDFAQAQEMKQSFGIEQPRLMVAWHGSPHVFEKFSTEKIGTGEGAQVYGWGLYFAGEREVAEYYRKQIAGAGRVLFDGDDIQYMREKGQNLVKALTKRFGQDGTYALTTVKGQGGIYEAHMELMRRGLTGAVKWLQENRGRIKVEGPKGGTYQVDLKPSEDEYLDWDKPLSEQSEKVKKALESFGEERIGMAANFGFPLKDKSEIWKKRGMDLYQGLGSFLTNAGKSKYGRNVALATTPQEAASAYLHSLGIRGIKYLDQGSRDQGEGTYNYVIFDDADVEIKARYSVKASRPDQAAQDLEYLAAVKRGDMGTAQRIVDEAAKRAGYNIEGWHGTPRETFTVFRADQGRTHDRGYYGDGFYFTFGDKRFSPGEAEYYGQNVIRAYIKTDKPFVFKKLIEYKGHQVDTMGDDSVFFLANVAKMFPEIADTIELAKYERNPKTYERTAIGSITIRDLPALIEKYDKRLKTEIIVGGMNGDVIQGYVNSTTVEFDNTAYGGKKGSYEDIEWLNGRFDPRTPDHVVRAALISDAIDRYEGVKPDFHPEGYMTRNPQITEAIKSRGYDSIMQSESGDEIVVFSPSKIKSAEAVVRDDTGRIIPPSERFNPQSDDIRYSFKASGDWQQPHLGIVDQNGAVKLSPQEPRKVNGMTIGPSHLVLFGEQARFSQRFGIDPSGKVLWTGDVPDKETQYAVENEAARYKLVVTGHDTLSAPRFGRFSFAATRPLQSGNSRAVASLAVQRLLGQELTTEKAARAAYLHQAEDATPDQLIAEANRLADSKVGEAMKQALASPDPTTAYRIGAANAELDAISAARAGVQTGLKMGISATKAEQTATKRLIRDAEAAQAQDFVVATGIDPVKVMLAVQPDVFAAREQEQEGPQLPEGPQQESGQKAEPPKATPEQIAERDRRKRNIVEQVRAWADQERARREKEAEEAAKKKAEGAEGAGEGAEAPQEEAPDEPGIPPELLTGEGADLRDANEMARALRLWIADWIVERSKGRLTHQTLWADAEAVSQYKKTSVAILTDAAYKMVAPGDYALSTIQGMIDDLPSVAKPDTVERRSASVIAVIQANAIRQSRNELIAQIRKDIDAMALQGGPVDPMQEDLKRKITGEQQKTAAFVKRILSWSPKKIEAEREKIKAELEGRENLYRDSANGEEPLKVAIDAQYHHNLMKLQMLDRWGGIKGMLPAEIVEAGIEIRGWMKSAQERLYARWQDMAAQTGKLTADIARAVVPEDQNAPRPKDGWFDAFLGSHLATVRQRLEGLVRNAKDEPTRQAALAAIEELMFHLSRGSEIYATTINDYRKAWTDAVAEITGSRKAASQYLRHLDEPIPADVSAKVSRQGFAGTMTYGQAIQLYASLKQVGSYAENVRRHKRLDHADLIESILTPEDVKLVGRLRRIYEQRRAALSDVVRSVTGIPVWRPDPLYMPVQMLTGRPGGLGIVGTVRAWNPLADSLTPRRRNGLDFDESVSVQDMFMQRSEDAARAIAFGARGILIRGVLGDADFQNAVDRYVGKGKLTELLKQTTQAMAGLGRENADKASRVAAWLRRVNTYTALSGNMLSAAKQTVSFPVFAMTLDGGFREVVESVKAFDRQALAELMDSDGYRARYGGGISPEIAEAMLNPDANLVKRLYAAGMSVIKIGDMVASLSVATGIYKAKKAAYVDQGMDESAATERAKTMTWAMVEETQQSSRPENMPAFYRNQNEFLKLFLQFASAPALQLSHEFHAAADVKAGVPGAKGRLARAILINHFIVPALLDLMSSGFYWLLGRPPEDEDKELWRRIRDRVAWNFLIGPFSRMLIVGAVVDGVYNASVHGKLMTLNGMLPAESTLRTLSRLARTPYDVATQDTEQLRDDLLKAIEGASAPARHAIMLYENRIAGE